MGKTKLQTELMNLVNDLREYGVPDALIERFERVAIKRHHQIVDKRTKG